MCKSCNATTFEALKVGDKFTDHQGVKLMVVGYSYKGRTEQIKGFATTKIDKTSVKFDAVVLETVKDFRIGDLVICEDGDYVQKIN